MIMVKRKSSEAKQLKVKGALERGGKLTIREMARSAFPGVRPVEKADSWVRNSLRVLVRDHGVRKVGRGTYSA
jgi:hypothetical protein